MQSTNSPVDTVYDNVFEAIRALDPQNPACNGAFSDGSLFRRQGFAPFLLEDSTIGLIEQRELSMFLLYGFATDMLDLTCDVVVAAFFATHYYDARKLRYEIVPAGVGRIRYIRIPTLAERVFPIGLQPFQRPGLQSGFGMLLDEGEDFAQMSESVCFRQDADMNRRFSRAILANGMTLPNEGVAHFAALLHDSPVVTRAAVQESCLAKGMRAGDVADALASAGISIVDAPLVAADDYARMQRAPRARVRRVAVSQPAFT